MSSNDGCLGEAIGYLIVISLGIMLIGVIISLIIQISIYVVGGIAVVGTGWGVLVSSKNFAQVLIEAHKELP